MKNSYYLFILFEFFESKGFENYASGKKIRIIFYTNKIHNSSIETEEILNSKFSTFI